MEMLSEDDLNLKDMTDEELGKAWDLWFDLAQSTNDDDPPYTHGVFVNLTWEDVLGDTSASRRSARHPEGVEESVIPCENEEPSP